MSKKLITKVILTLALTACGATQAPSSESNSGDSAVLNNLLEVSFGDLGNYWQAKPVNPVMLKSRPKWIPKGAGKFSYFVVIDSQGNEVSKTLVGSTPEGWMTQAKLDKMPKASYVASETNPEHKPVKVLMTAEVIRMAGKR
ncbi:MULTISPECIES: hypothetical protein [Shewanella]|uniref:hypothetical protein n=1 Tax=Shewanella TaxID=22 RepID=UPI001EFDF036|nr:MULTISPECIES: hypothetical protein [Shewanella]MCG9746398.1 hypothetical protein [Shewanella sp. Isolate8]MCL2909528.1 hypothetical protein [Shewanella aquimarina]